MKLHAGALALALAAVLTGASAVAQAPDPAAVGRDRPLTSTWFCENERSVLVNAHPRRRAEEAWLTYGGTRVQVERVPTESGVAFDSHDGKVKWRESGEQATLEFEDLLKAPLLCRLRQKSNR